MQRSLGLVQVDEIYLTHFHADHILGLPGLLKTYDLTDREPPLTIYGPRGLRELFTILEPLIGRLGFDLELVELEPGEGSPTTATRSSAFEAAHNVRAIGYALVEEERPGRFDPEAAKRLGRRRRPGLRRAAARGGGRGSAGTVRPSEVMGEPRPGRTVVAHRRHRALPRDRRRRRRRRAADPRRQLRRGGGPARRRNRPLDRRPGRRGRRRGAREDARPGPHLLPLPRRQGPRGGPRGLPRLRRPAATSTSIEIPFPERGEPELDPEWSPRTGESGRASTEPPQSRGEGLPRPPPPLLRCGRPLTRSREARKEAKSE